jgi:hypothetical protein
MFSMAKRIHINFISQVCKEMPECLKKSLLHGNDLPKSYFYRQYRLDLQNSPKNWLEVNICRYYTAASRAIL